jgi:hypothetical protein
MHQNTGEIFILEKDAKTILFSNLDHYPRDLFANIIRQKNGKARCGIKAR